MADYDIGAGVGHACRIHALALCEHTELHRDTS